MIVRYLASASPAWITLSLFLFSIGFAEFSQLLVTSFRLKFYQPALWIHSAGALLIWRFYKMPFAVAGPVALAWLWKFLRTYPYLPAGSLAGGTMIIGGIAAQETGPLGSIFNLDVLALVFFVPIVEEVFYRKGLGSYLVGRFGPGWGIYWSGFFFSWMHFHPTFERLAELNVGLFLGPLLLGWCCEALVRASGSIKPAIVLHIVANATVPFFETVAPDLLERLSLFYLK